MLLVKHAPPPSALASCLSRSPTRTRICRLPMTSHYWSGPQLLWFYLAASPKQIFNCRVERISLEFWQANWTRKLDWCLYQVRKKLHHGMYNCFYTIPLLDRQTDGQTDGRMDRNGPWYITTSRSACWRAIKLMNGDVISAARQRQLLLKTNNIIVHHFGCYQWVI